MPPLLARAARDRLPLSIARAPRRGLRRDPMLCHVVPDTTGREAL
jgi:hypothetical protein